MDILARLADAEYLRREWVDHDFSQRGFWVGPVEILSGLYDDLGVLPDPSIAVGVVVVEGEECERLHRLADLLDRVQVRVTNSHEGSEYSLGPEYLDDPEWPEVARAAGLALASMVRNNAPL